MPYGLRFPQVGAIHELPLPVETRSPKPLQNRHVLEMKFVYLTIAKSVGSKP
jgi:hypothetical protein